MADGISAAYRTPEITESVLRRVKPIAVSPVDLHLLAKNDPWFQRQKKEADKLQAQRLPSATEISQAWQAVVKAYWIWINMATARQERNAKIQGFKSKMTNRLIELQRKVTWQRIHHIRQKMGSKFTKTQVSSGGKFAESSVPRIVVEPSSSAKETTI